MTTSTWQGTDRFTMGLVIEVAEVLEAHGYGRCDGRQFVELQQHLFHFLHGTSGGCNGRRMDGAR
jgi:hypothetical protein